MRINSRFSYNKAKQIEYYNHNIKDSYTYEKLAVAPRIGYEFIQDYNKIRVFYGADIVGSITKSIQNSDSYNFTTSKFGLGLSPLLGMKYFINHKISISTETSFNILFQRREDKKIYYSKDDESTSTTNSIYANLSPLGIISINFHF